jgi:Lysine methyltransferase
MEGLIPRNLFRTSYDTDDDDDDDDDDNEEEDKEEEKGVLNYMDVVTEKGTNVYVTHPIRNILIDEQSVGGSIAQRLWPSAEYLAQFIEQNTFQLENHFQTANNSPLTSTTNTTTSITETKNMYPLRVIELGAGVGLTGLLLASSFPCQVLLTDLDEAMPLLQRNIIQNRSKFLAGESSVQAQVLRWGNEEDAKSALEWMNHEPTLVIASDCVYFPNLHEPLEQTFVHLLRDHPQSIGWIAGMRRWKSDNQFYKTIGRKTRTPTHQLQCTCLGETVVKTTDDTQRQITRVYSITWTERIPRK